MRKKAQSDFIGEKILGIINSMRDEAIRLIAEADDIDSAWTEWDIEYLVSNNVITPREAATLEKEFADMEGGTLASRRKQASFTADSSHLFDKLVGMSESGEAFEEPVLSLMYDIAIRKSATKAVLSKFGRLAEQIKNRGLREIITGIVQNISDGKYTGVRGEFRYSYNPPGNSSATGELFSLFRQAYDYYM